MNDKVKEHWPEMDIRYLSSLAAGTETSYNTKIKLPAGISGTCQARCFAAPADDRRIFLN